MKKTLLSLLMCIMCIGAWAQTDFRAHRYDSFKSTPIKSNSIVFVGNSITNMHPWVEAFGDDARICNRGNSGGKTNEILANVRSYCAGQPAKIFILIGTNDISANVANATIVDNIKRTMSTIREVSPATRIYVNSILPRTNTNTTIQAINDLLQTMITDFNTRHSADHNDVTYIDSYTQLVGKLDAKNAGGVTYSYDGLHMTAAGYRIWTKQIEGYLAEDGISTVYPENTGSIQQNTNNLSLSFGARATYFSVLPIKSDDVLFFGDEMVHSGEWHELLGNIHVKNRGTNWGYEGTGDTYGNAKGGINSTFANVSGVVKNTPKQVLLYTGTGEVNNTGKTMETVVNGYKEIVALIRSKVASDTKINIVSLMPTSNTNARVKEFNAAIEAYAGETANVEYIDIYSALTSGDAQNSSLFMGNMPLGPGYVKIANVLKNYITGCNAVTETQAADYRNSLKVSFRPSTVQDPYEYELSNINDITIANDLTILGTNGSTVPSGHFIFIAQSAENQYKIYETSQQKYVALVSGAATSQKSQTRLVSDVNSAEIFNITASTTDGYFLISPSSIQPTTYLNYFQGKNQNNTGQTAGFYATGNGDAGSRWAFTKFEKETDADALATLNTALKYSGLIGAGLGKFHGTVNDVVLTQEIFDAKAGELQTAIDNSTDVLTKAAELKAYINALLLNMPVAQSFLTIKGINNKYISGGTETTSASGLNCRNQTANATDGIFYWDGSHLVGYKSGQGFSGTNGVAAVGATMDVQTFEARSEAFGKYAVKCGNNFFYDFQNGACIARQGSYAEQCAWTLADVTDLPIKMNLVGDAYYATINMPVAVEIPAGLKAYSATASGDELTLKKVVEDGVLAANTPVILYGGADVASLRISVETGSAATGSNELQGTTAAKLVGSGENYVLNNKTAGVGFYKYSNTTMPGFKAYLPAGSLSSARLSFNFSDVETAIKAIEAEENADATVYDLAGRKLAGLQKGINIVNGKKVIR